MILVQRRLITLLVVTRLIGTSRPRSARCGIPELNGVVVTSVGTSAERTVVTGPDGRFIVPTLRPGVYNVSVELAGFQPQRRDNVDLSVGQEVTLSFGLAVSGVAENLVVTGQAPVVE